MNILAIGAHPDDIELGCGGLLLKAVRAGHDIFMCVLTRGDASEDPVERSKELVASAKFIGAKKLWIDNFGDTHVSVGNSLINHLEYYIHRTDPDIILTHSIGDYHHDHRAIAECTVEAARYSQNILAYEMSVTKDFRPQVYYDISDAIQKKIELIQIFWSQQTKHFVQANAIRGLAEYRAQQSRLSTSISAVESYEIVKMCFSDDFTLLKMRQHPVPQAVLKTVGLEQIIEWTPSSEFKSKNFDETNAITINNSVERKKTLASEN